MTKIDPKAVAAARRRRTHRLRTRIAVLSSSAFLALFAGITVQMASGHDPVLTAKTSTTSTTTTSSPSTSTSTSTSTSSDSSSTSTGSSDTSSSSSSQPASVTTSQS